MPRFVVPSAFRPRNRWVTFSSSRWYGMIRWQLPESRSRDTSTPVRRSSSSSRRRCRGSTTTPSGDHRRDVRIEDAGGDQLELEEAALGDHRVAGVVPALIADHEVHPVREVVDGLALALVPPLGPEHDRGRHVLRSVSVVPGDPAAVPLLSPAAVPLLSPAALPLPSWEHRWTSPAEPTPDRGTRVTKNWEEIELEKLVEIDGEYCVPHELNEARHVVDWGPFEPPRGAGYIIRKLLLFLPAMYLFILAVQIMKTGAAAIGPRHPGSVPVRERDLDVGVRLARRVLRAVGLAGRGHGDQPVRSGDADAAPDVHDALGIAPGCIVHRVADRVPLRRAQPARPQPERADRDGDPGDDDDGARLSARAW